MNPTRAETSGRPLPLVPEGVWIVVAAYCEGERLRGTLGALCRTYREVVVVDDGSLDDTYRVASKFPVHLLRHTVNRGQGAALQTGFDFALSRGARIVVTFDGDGQHCVEDIARLIAPLERGEVDVALGSRFRGRALNLGWKRWLVLKLGVLFTRVVSRISVTDTHNGLRAFSARSLRELRIVLDRMAHASEILDKIHTLRLRFVEVPVTIRYSEESLAKGQRSREAMRIALRFLLAKFSR